MRGGPTFVALAATAVLASACSSSSGPSSATDSGTDMTDAGTLTDSGDAEAGGPVLDPSGTGAAWSLDGQVWTGSPRCQKAGDSWVVLVASSTPAGGGVVLTFQTKPTAGAYLAETAGAPTAANRVVVNTTKTVDGSPVGYLASSGEVNVTLDGAQVQARYTALPSSPVGDTVTATASGILLCP